MMRAGGEGDGGGVAQDGADRETGGTRAATGEGRDTHLNGLQTALVECDNMLI